MASALSAMLLLGVLVFVGTLLLVVLTSAIQLLWRSFRRRIKPDIFENTLRTLNTRITGKRFVALLIDSILIWFFWMPIISLLLGLVFSEEPSQLSAWSDSIEGFLEELDLAGIWMALVVVYLSWFLTALSYYSLLEGLFGCTIGKFALGIRTVCMRDGGKPGVLRAFVRSLFLILDGVGFYFVGWFVAMFSGTRRRLGDYAAGTLVVSRPVRISTRTSPARTYSSRSTGHGYTVTSPPPSQSPPAQSRPRQRLPRPTTTPISYRSPTTQHTTDHSDHVKEKIRYRGEESEAHLREAIAPLAEYGYYSFSNLPHRYFGDIDSLLVGPGGVFVIDAKSHRCTVTEDPYSGKLLKDGSSFQEERDGKDFYGQLRKQVGHIRKTLSEREDGVPVFGKICFTRARLQPNRWGQTPDQVCLVKDIADYVYSSVPVLSPEKVRRLVDRIERVYHEKPDVVPPSGPTHGDQPQ